MDNLPGIDLEAHICWNCAHSSANLDFFKDWDARGAPKVRAGFSLSCYRFGGGIVTYTHKTCGEFCHRAESYTHEPLPPRISPLDDIEDQRRVMLREVGRFVRT
jgi:rRNA maturation protein Nop10